MFKRSRLRMSGTVGFMALILSAPLVNGGEPASALTEPNKETGKPNFGAYRLSGPYTHENLTIFLIHGDDQLKDKTFLTLQEALAQKKVVVHETKNVNELTIENLAPNEEVFVQAGDIVKGGQQDRVLAFDLILPAKSGKIAIASFCVEAGRWTRRGDEAVGNFEVSTKQAATKDLKLAVRQNMMQRKVWENVASAQMRLGRALGKGVQDPASASSLQLSLEDKDLEKAVNTYVKKLEPACKGQNDIIGYAFAVNGKIDSADLYASHTLFKKVWPTLLNGSAVEAFAEKKKDKKKFEPVTVEAMKKFLVNAADGKQTEKEVTKRVKQVQLENKKGVLFETRDQANKGLLIRRSYIAY